MATRIPREKAASTGTVPEKAAGAARPAAKAEKPVAKAEKPAAKAEKPAAKAEKPAAKAEKPATKSRAKAGGNAAPATRRRRAAAPSTADTPATPAPAVSPQERHDMIAFSAYLRAEARGFTGSSAETDWLEAEAEIDRMLGAR
jgi:1,4-alpha-glucan branching enzyme